ncbi:MAG: peptidase M50, partial [Gammaproteobacteria bacterium]
MSQQGDNPLWYRVASVRPRLVAHAELQKQVFREDTWYVLHNLAAGRAYRFTPRFHRFIALLDGKRSVDQALAAANATLGEESLNQDEAMEVLARLYLADVLQTDAAGDALELFERQRRQRQAQRMQQAKNPLAIKLPLFDPHRILSALEPLGRRLFTVGGLLAWVVFVTSGAVLAFTHWERLVGGDGPQILSPGNLLLIGLCYPVVKALHELGHGLATRVWGGEVHQAGLLFVAFMPLPYVDASASNAFPERHRRIVVSAAGIMVELALAAAALMLWLAIEPGIVRNIAYNVMLIGSVSTLFFNGNPLLKFDGYYVLTDAAGLPNFASRANRYLAYLVKHHVFGVAGHRSPVTHESEPPWLLIYGVLAWCYRIVIVLVIAMFVAESYPTIGVGLALWSITSTIVWPVAKHGAKLFTDPELSRRRSRALALSGAALTLALVGIFVVPMPLATVTQGVIAPPSDAEVRAGHAGVLAAFVTGADSAVQRGDPLITLEDPFLDPEIARLEGELAALEARRKQSESERRQVEVAMLADQAAVLRADLARARERRAALDITSPADGVFLLAQVDDLPGRFVEQGELLGYVA